MTPKELLDTILGYLGFVVQIDETQSEGGNPTLQIYMEESHTLIGRDGETLEAIQFLLNRLIQAKDKDAPKVIVDCEHYRSMREDRIVQRVRELAERVRISGRSLQLEPMNSYERRIVHNAFKDDPDVATWSPPIPRGSSRSRSSSGRRNAKPRRSSSKRNGVLGFARADCHPEPRRRRGTSADFANDRDKLRDLRSASQSRSRDVTFD